LLRSQEADGFWAIESNPEWNVVATALVVALMVEGGVPPACKWKTDSSPSGGPAASLAWLAARTNADGTWGSDLWDTCQVIRALLRCGISRAEPVIVAAAIRVRSGLLDEAADSADLEWFGAGFYAAALTLFLALDDTKGSRQCIELLLRSQTDSGDFAGIGGRNDPRVPSEWHTSQAITALSAVDEDDARKAVARARTWLLSRQRSDGSWGTADGPYQRFKVFFTSYAVLALLSSDSLDRGAATKACRWLKHQQSASGRFGDVASSLMAMSALQAYHGAAFSMRIPTAVVLRLQAHLTTDACLLAPETS
jgi:hypothetical protein